MHTDISIHEKFCYLELVHYRGVSIVPQEKELGNKEEAMCQMAK
jgi:hypothetical protein